MPTKRDSIYEEAKVKLELCKNIISTFPGAVLESITITTEDGAMAKLKIGSSFEEVKENSGGSRTVIPNGDYNAIIIDIDLCDTKSGTGQYVKAKFEILDGDYQGEYMTAIINVKNDSAKAQEIGLGQFKALCMACGLSNFPDDTDELLKEKCTIKVKVKKEVYEGNEFDKSEIVGYAEPVKTGKKPWGK